MTYIHTYPAGESKKKHIKMATVTTLMVVVKISLVSVITKCNLITFHFFVISTEMVTTTIPVRGGCIHIRFFEATNSFSA